MNKVNLIGRLTKDVELRYTQTNNTAVASFTLAVDRRYKKDGQPTADFINCQAWSKTAEFISKYFAKGSQIAITGRIQTRTWDAEGKRHYATEVVVEEAYFTGSKRDNQQDNQQEGHKQDNSNGWQNVENDDELPF